MARKQDATLDDLLTQMKISNRLFAARLKENVPQNELVRLLSTTGATNAEIAEVLDTSASVVSTTLSRLRKKT